MYRDNLFLTPWLTYVYLLIIEQLSILIDKPYLLPLTKETEEIALFFFFYSSALFQMDCTKSNWL